MTEPAIDHVLCLISKPVHFSATVTPPRGKAAWSPPGHVRGFVISVLGFCFLIFKVSHFLPDLKFCELLWTNVTETRRQDRNLDSVFFLPHMQIPFLKWNRLSQQICWALSVMKLICQCLGPRNFIKVKQGIISEMHFWTEENAYVSCCKRCSFSVAWENNREADVRTWVFCLTQAFSNCTFLLCGLLLTRHFNMKGHLSFVSVHIYLSAFQMVKWEVPEIVIFVSWVLGIHSIPGVFFRLYYAFCWVNVMEMHLVTLNPFL